MELERIGRLSDDESSDVVEDSDGELINEKVSEKFISTLARIRTKDPTIYKPEKTFFKGMLA
jgi:protein KRI1